jgi:hypothetical protein
MQLLTVSAFEQKIASSWKPTMDTASYEHFPFRCACGKTHLLGETVPMREMAGMRLLLSCPTLQASGTIVRIKRFFWLGLLVSEYGLRD